MNHNLHRFMNQISDEMDRNYKGIQEWAATDPGTAGDQGEENWAEWMREWLPPTYRVVTKGRIINPEGKVSRQIDVLVLKPFYPKRLHSEKHYLSAGVAAAFECKTTLKASHIDEAVGICAELKYLCPIRTGSPYKELNAPIAYGLLAHSHDWKGKKSTPVDNIQQQLSESTDLKVTRPRVSLDFLCVADFGTWVWWTFTTTHDPNLNRQFRDGIIHGGHLLYSPSPDVEANDFTPVGSLYVNLMERLAWEDSSLRDIVDYYRVAEIDGKEGGSLPHHWDLSEYSETVQNQIKGGRLSNSSLSWNEWFGFRA